MRVQQRSPDETSGGALNTGSQNIVFCLARSLQAFSNEVTLHRFEENVMGVAFL